MRRVGRSVLIGILFLLGLSSPTFAEDKFMDLAELEELLATRGPFPATYKTVTRGIQPGTFSLTVRDVIQWGSGGLIVFTMPEKIVAGMSGSPVYVVDKKGNERLIGALSMMLSRFMSGQQWGGITPIVQMAAEAQGGAAESSGAASVPGNVQYKDMTFVPIALGSAQFLESLSRQTNPSASLESRMLELAKHGLVMSVTSAGQAQATVSTKTMFHYQPRFALRAGMPILVDLLEWKDPAGNLVSIGGLGTITFIGDDGRVFAFGHPFLQARKVKYHFRTCKIVGMVLSDFSSYKLGGDKSDVLGTITYDGGEGIYGKLGQRDPSMPTLNLNFQKKTEAGVAESPFELTLANTPIMPTLLDAAFNLIGNAVGAPAAQEVSTTAMQANISLEKYGDVTFSQLYGSERRQFGLQVGYMSSYDVACEQFIARMFLPVTTAPFPFTINNVAVQFTFMSGAPRRLTLAEYRFPNKIQYGTDPVMELALVGEDNKVTLLKQVKVAIDWDKVEEPEYTAETKNTDKKPEKVVGGNIAIYSVDFYGARLSNEEREKESPTYFLNAEDFLALFRRSASQSTDRLFVKLQVRRKSGLLDQALKDAKSILPEGPFPAGWVVVPTGLGDRKSPLREEWFISFPVDIPRLPSEFMISKINTAINFEVVK